MDNIEIKANLLLLEIIRNPKVKEYFRTKMMEWLHDGGTVTYDTQELYKLLEDINNG